MKRPALTALAALLLSACASAPQGSLERVQQLAAERMAPSAAPAGKDAILAAPLTPDSAVQLALSNNPSLRAAYADVGIAVADLDQAGRLPNPSMSFTRVVRGGEVEIERKLMLPIVALLTMPNARAIEQHRLGQAELRAAQEVLRVAADTRRAWYAAVAARETLVYMEQVKSAADASDDLARRMAKAGNWSALQQARQQAFHADATALLAKARAQASSESEKLTRLLGLPAPTFTLPDRLPELPAKAQEAGDAESRALRNRLDLVLAERELQALAESLGLVRGTRFFNAFELGPVSQSPGAARGIEVEWQLPLFDQGGARVARAEAQYQQAAQRAAASAIAARSEVRAAYAAYAASHAVARHYLDEIVPLRKRIADEQLLRYNGMLASVFDLLADAREQVLAVSAAIDAQRDFWMAQSDLDAALQGYRSMNKE